MFFSVFQEPELKPKAINKRGRKQVAADKKPKIEELKEEMIKEEKTNDEPQSTDAEPEVFIFYCKLVVTKKRGNKQTAVDKKPKAGEEQDKQEKTNDEPESQDVFIFYCRLL